MPSTTSRPSRATSRRRARGVTLVELVTVTSIVGVLASFAIPSFSTFMTGQQLRAAGTDMMSSLLLARSEAIKRNAQVRVAPPGADWTQGWQVTVVTGAAQLDAKNPLGQQVHVVGAPGEIVYERSGRLAVAGVTRVEFRDAGGHATSRCLAIDPSGLPKISLGHAGSCT
jgi:type IV fimbrial biogenesis protein FimT